MAASRLTEDVLPPQLFEKMKPDFITPLVLYLASEQCTDTGMIINCTLGYYSRSAIVTGPGAFLSDGHKIPEPEEIMAAWDKIKSLENPKYFDQLRNVRRAGPANSSNMVCEKWGRVDLISKVHAFIKK